ncbi:MAG: internal scaffolding protein [Microviridae sp.]|nr:MAG: internal scaffolding protein [Microviridae sp.]
MFKTQYDPHPRVLANPGSGIRILYQARYNASGTLELYPSGEENLYDYIQSHRDSVDIHVILKRFAAGEKDVLSQVQGFYADASNMPKTYAEVLNAVLEGERAFDLLPASTKAEFNNSFAEWLSAIHDENFAERMGFQPTPAGTDLSDSQVQDFSGTTPVPTPSPTPSPAPTPAIPNGNVPVVPSGGASS